MLGNKRYNNVSKTLRNADKRFAEKKFCTTLRERQFNIIVLLVTLLRTVILQTVNVFYYKGSPVLMGPLVWASDVTGFLTSFFRSSETGSIAGFLYWNG